MIDPGETLLVAGRAIAAAENGEPFDLAGARANILATADQLEAMAVDARYDDDGRQASRHLAQTTTGLARVFDALVAGDTALARLRFRQALWAPTGGDRALYAAIGEEMSTRVDISSDELAHLLYQRTTLAAELPRES